MNNNKPLVSIVMSVYNAQKYLKEAIESILNQTYTTFEFIIINDGSSDCSLDIIQSYNDSRIILISRENKGLIYSLNEGFSKARGKYIARQDADDISNNQRISKQIEYLEKNKNIYLLGTSANIIDYNGEIIEHINSLSSVNEKQFLRFNPFIHGSILMRREVLDDFNIWYDKKMLYIEDYDFFWRISCRHQCANLAEYLYNWRRHGQNISISKVETQVQNKYLRRMLYKKKISNMDVNQLNWLQKRKMLGMIENNKGHYLLKLSRIKAICKYMKSLFIYPDIKAMVFFVCSIINPNFLIRLIR